MKRRRDETSPADKKAIRALVRWRIMLRTERDLCALEYMEIYEAYRMTRKRPAVLYELQDRIEKLERKIAPLTNDELGKRFNVAPHTISNITTNNRGLKGRRY